MEWTQEQLRPHQVCHSSTRAMRSPHFFQLEKGREGTNPPGLLGFPSPLTEGEAGS